MATQLDELIQTLVYPYLKKFNVPGISITIAKDGEIIYNQGFGFRNIEEKLPMTPSTLIGIGSCTKSFTSLAIMQLVEAGMFSLEDTVNSILDIHLPTKSTPITVKHLLSHTSGIPSFDLAMNVFQLQREDYSKLVPCTTPSDFYSLLQNSGSYIKFQPGEKLIYSNDMYYLAGLIIEHFSGMSYDAYVKTHILDPLEMSRSTFTQAGCENDIEQNVMVGYLPNNDSKQIMRKQPFPFDPHVYACGGLLTSTEQLTNFGLCLLQGGKFKDQQLISSASIDKLWNPELPFGLYMGENPQYCLGWIRDDDFFGHKLIYHGGSVNVSGGFLSLIPDLGIVMAIASNSYASLPYILSRALVTQMVGEDPLIVDKVLQGFRITDEVVGIYTSYLNLYKAEIKSKDGTLYIDAEIDDGMISVPLYLKDPEKLIFQVVSLMIHPLATVQFYRSPQTGKIEYLMFDRYLYLKK